MRADAPPVEFRILGPLEAVAGGRALDLGSPKQRDLLAVLLINAGRVVSTSQLADELWSGEPPDRPEPTLQAYVSRLRKVLGAERLVTRAPGYALDVGSDEIDALRFERLLIAGREARAAGDPERARALLREALALWRGRALDGVRLAAADTEGARLEALRLDCVEERIDSELALGAGAELVAELQTLVEADPLRERVAGQLAVALYRAGRQSDALDVLQNVATALREQLGVDPSPSTRALEESILRQELVLEQRATAYVAADASQPRGFIGRGDELAAVDTQLSEPGLLTLTGLGGTGKTSLAFAVAEARDDVEAIVRLAPLRDGELILRAIATALDVAEAPGRRIDDLVGERLRASSGVLVLDNCEHLRTHVAATVLALRATCPDLRILATSREPIGTAHERVWAVPPMRPEDASKLFVQRAAAANPGVVLPFDAVERVCARVGGIPLAVELAAARTRVLSVDQIAERLGDVVLTIDPDERLASALSWAVDELGSREQLLLERLSVFAGAFSLEDAEAVCSDEQLPRDAILASLGRLVEMSLLATEPAADPMRYRMLEPVRQFAARRSSDPAAIAERHFRWAMDVARTDVDEAVEHASDDLRSALGWAITDANDPSGGLELACTLAGYWRVHGHVQEGLRWLGAAILASPDDDPLLGDGHRRYSELAYAAGRETEAASHARTAIAMAGAASDDHTLAWATMSLAVALHLDDPDESYALYDRALEAAKRAGDEMLVMQILHNTATMYSEGGDNVAATSRFEEALEIARRRDDPEAIVIITQCLARLALDRRALDEARELTDASLVLARRSRVMQGITHGIWVLGYISYVESDYVRAHAYYEELVEMQRETANPIGEIEALVALADCLQRRGMSDEALRTAHQARVIAETLDMPRYIDSVNDVLGDLYLERGDVGRAAACLGDSLGTSDPMGARRWWSRVRTVCKVLGTAGAHERVAVLLGAFDTLLREAGRPPFDEFDPGLVVVRDDARDALGDEFEASWTRGGAMSMDDATAFASDALLTLTPSALAESS